MKTMNEANGLVSFRHVDSSELTEVNGGGWGILAAAAVVTLAATAVVAADNAYDGGLAELWYRRQQ